ncbi:peroxidase 5-like [Humulus lupulus]|uniref:peroxidase 5-like n=1 Tax=Humulus lupulus TaxID=3486 RepID=UPI002B40F29B|nr:peroxidase 5-like [Humulus lupulus]
MKDIHVVVIFTLSLVLLPKAISGLNEGQMHVGFYREKCPHAEFLVSHYVAKAFIRDRGIAAGLIRLLFHDCFVKGCDASILLDSTFSGEPVEKDSVFNGKSLRGFEVIDKIKTKLEILCPETVSCADLLVFAAREAVFLSGLPYYAVHGGRRDSRTSRSADVNGNLPMPTMPMEEIIRIFASKGLTVEDLVVLSGAHSIGRAHCMMFEYRLNETSRNDPYSPSMEPTYAAHLKRRCNQMNLSTKIGKRNAIVRFDPSTADRLDNVYYVNLLKGRGLLQSDQALVFDPHTERLVKEMAFDSVTWSRKFVNSMTRLGHINVLTGYQVRLGNFKGQTL